MKTQKEQVQEIIRREFLGHPSREDEGRISNLEEIVIKLAEQIDKLKTEQINSHEQHR